MLLAETTIGALETEIATLGVLVRSEYAPSAVGHRTTARSAKSASRWMAFTARGSRSDGGRRDDERSGIVMLGGPLAPPRGVRPVVDNSLVGQMAGEVECIGRAVFDLMFTALRVREPGYCSSGSVRGKSAISGHGRQIRRSDGHGFRPSDGYKLTPSDGVIPIT